MDIDIIRAWKDQNYRNSLSEEERALLPKNPIGSFELIDDELKDVIGAQAQTGGVASSVGIGGCQNTSNSGNCQSVNTQQCQTIGSGGSCGSQAQNCQVQQNTYAAYGQNFCPHM